MNDLTHGLPTRGILVRRNFSVSDDIQTTDWQTYTAGMLIFYQIYLFTTKPKDWQGRTSKK